MSITLTALILVVATAIQSLFYRSLFQYRWSRIRYLLFATSILGLWFVIGNMQVGFVLQGVLNKIILIVLTYALFDVTWQQALYMALMLDVMYYGLRGMIIGAFAGYTLTKISDIMVPGVQIIQINCIVILIIVAFITCVPKKIKHKQFKEFLEDKQLVNTLIIFLFIVSIYIMLINDGRYLNHSNTWFVSLYFFSAVLCTVMVGYLQFFVLRIRGFMDERTRNVVRLRTLEFQVDHLETLQASNESLRKFKHDYVTMLEMINYYVYEEDYDGLSTYLKDIDAEMKLIRDTTLKQSNHSLLDAMLYNARQKAIKYNVNFDAEMYVPPGLELSDYSLVRIFSNLFSNAVEASIQTENGFVMIRSSVKDHWFKISVQNSFSSIRLEKNTLQTTKADASQHGYGLQIIREEVEEQGGFYTQDIDELKHTFKTNISLPIKNDD